MSTIQFKNLKKHFGKVKAVDGVSLEVKKGEIFGFLGPNGAGKTTTIRCMMDFLRPTNGTITILGKDSVIDTVELKKSIGHLSGNAALYDKWTGQEHIDYIETLRGKSRILGDLVKRLKFDTSKKSKALSTGNKQKLGLILALMHEPEILVLDEPTNGLDPLLQNVIYDILREFKSRGTTIFVSSHNLPEVEKICDRVAIIREGKLIAVESMATLKKKKVYKVRAIFDGKFKKEDFAISEVENYDETSNSITLKIKKDINETVRKLYKYKLKDIEITHASLEDTFLEFYKDNA